MAENGGPPTAPAFNPNIQGGLNAPADPSKRLFGVLTDSGGMAQHMDTRGFHQAKMPGVILFSQKNTGWKGFLEQQLGIRTTAKFEGFEGVQGTPVDTSGGGGGNATYDQVYGAAQTIMVHGGELRGFNPNSDLGQMAAPATPGMGQSRGKGGVGL